MKKESKKWRREKKRRQTNKSEGCRSDGERKKKRLSKGKQRYPLGYLPLPFRTVTKKKTENEQEQKTLSIIRKTCLKSKILWFGSHMGGRKRTLKRWRNTHESTLTVKVKKKKKRYIKNEEGYKGKTTNLNTRWAHVLREQEDTHIHMYVYIYIYINIYTVNDSTIMQRKGIKRRKSDCYVASYNFYCTSTLWLCSVVLSLHVLTSFFFFLLSCTKLRKRSRERKRNKATTS